LALLCETGALPRDRIVAAHFDHRLRGDAASCDERRAVEALCARYGVAFEIGCWDAAAAGEAQARAARYAYLARVAADRGATSVATGHTADDQVETVVMNLMRGAGMYGIAGMAASAPWPFAAHQGLRLLRPALSLTRDETRAYCEARGIDYLEDASNDDRAYLRNRVRLDLLPAMDAAAPGARRTILQLATEARASIDAITPIVDVLVTRDSDGNVRISRAALGALPSALVPHAYRRAFVRLCGDAREFGSRHYDVLARAYEARTGSMFELPRGIVATVDSDAVVLSTGPLVAPRIDSAIAHAVPFSGVLGAWRIDVARGDGEGALLLPADAVVRARRPGDRIVPRGMPPHRGVRRHKKLQDYYVDRKIARRERDAAPIIAAGAEVLWTPFGGAAEAGAGTPFTVRGLRVERGGSA
jgi:tRNA(Ile)-lysidine synthase